MTEYGIDNRKRRLFPTVVLIVLFAATRAGSADEWKKPVSFYWSDVPLRESLMRLGSAHRFGVFLDRHVDPEQAVSLEAKQEPLGAALERLAAANGLGVYLFDRCVYFGPTETARALPEILKAGAARCDALPVPTARALRKKKSLRFPILTPPRSLLEQTVADTGLTWERLDTLEHDLWSENSLPPLPVRELLTLLLIGFDADFTVDAATGHIAPVLLDRSDHTTVSHGTATTTEAGATGAGRSRPVSTRPAASPGSSRYTLTVKSQPLRAVLEQLSERIGLELEIDEESLRKRGISLDLPVSFEVKNVTAAALFAAAVRTVGASARIKGTKLSVN